MPRSLPVCCLLSVLALCAWTSPVIGQPKPPVQPRPPFEPVPPRSPVAPAPPPAAPAPTPPLPSPPLEPAVEPVPEPGEEQITLPAAQANAKKLYDSTIAEYLRDTCYGCHGNKKAT